MCAGWCTRVVRGSRQLSAVAGVAVVRGSARIPSSTHRQSTNARRHHLCLLPAALRSLHHPTLLQLGPPLSLLPCSILVRHVLIYLLTYLLTNLFIYLFVYLFIYCVVYTHVTSFTVTVKNGNCVKVTCHCRKARASRADLSLPCSSWVRQFMRRPFIKFLCHASSYLSFVCAYISSFHLV